MLIQITLFNCTLGKITHTRNKPKTSINDELLHAVLRGNSWKKRKRAQNG